MAKSAKIKSKIEHIDDKTLVVIIAKLEEMRAESENVIKAHLQSDLQQREEGKDVGDDLDKASNERDREFNLLIHQRHLRRLRELEAALERIDDGSYGLCEGTDEPINPKRLMIMPLARYSLEYQAQQERTLGRSPDTNLGDYDESFGQDE